MRPSVRTLLVAALALSCIPAMQAHGAGLNDPLPFLASPTAAPAPPPATPALAPVRLSLSSTSDWAVTKLTGARIVDLRVRSTSPGVSLTTGDGTFGMRAPSGGGSAEIDAIVAAPAQDATLSVEKGYHGDAYSTLRAGAAAPLTAAATQRAQPAIGTAVVPQQTLAAATVQAPRADDRRLVLAFYYPWFEHYEHWQMTEKPATPRSAVDPAGVLSMTQQARDNGVDGFVVSWSREHQDGTGYDLAVRAAEQTGGHVAPYLEVGALARRSHGTAELTRQVRDSLAEVLKRSSSPAMLRSEGVPVVFSFESDKLPAAAWKQVLSSLAAAGTPVRMATDAGGSWYDTAWGLHRYLANDKPDQLAAKAVETATRQRAADLLDGTRHLVTATVSPGYDDFKLRGLANPSVPRENGQRYDQTWNAALAADPDWVLVTSWNEWYEGTAIEPGSKTGYRALEQTKARAAHWKAS